MVTQMGDARRWTVTYTKHVKQKRKVYEDGALELHGSSSQKVMLYDDSGKLLDSRFLKKDEVIECGGTLAFDGHLVDIGDPEGDVKPPTDFNIEGRDKKPIEESGTLHGQKARCNSSSIESKRTDAGNNGAPNNCPNVLKNIKREYKKSDLHNSIALQSHPNATKATERENRQAGLQNTRVSQNHPNATQTTARARTFSSTENRNIGLKKSGAPQSHLNATQTTEVREWHVLYTTQMTQKAKKYHDGILRVEFRGFHGKQVMLYDASGKLLDSRFLKKDEVVESCEAIVFDAHLVDIGDPKEKARVPCGPEARYNSSIVENKESDMKNVGVGQNHSNMMQDSIREWHALYTTQITQKAKKFHDGILRLAICVSHRKQVILLNEDGTILSSKYLNSSEDVRTGSTLELRNYLVEIGEPRNSQGEPQNDASSGQGVGSYSSSSSVDKIKFSGSAARNNSIRDAHQILSTLKRPTPESLAPTRKAPVEQICPRQSSDLLQFGLQDKLHEQYAPEPNFSKGNAVDIHEDNPGNLNGGNNIQIGIYGSEISQSKGVQNLPTLSIINLIDPDHGGELLPDNSTLSNVSLCVAASSIPTSRSDVGYPDKSTTNPASSISGPPVSNIVILDLPDDTPSTSMPNEGLSGNVQIRESQLFPSSEGCGDNGSGTADVTDENSNQLCADMGTDNRCEKGFTLGLSGLGGSVSCCPNDAESESSDVLKSTPKERMDMDEFPSFDLGF